MNKTKTIVSLIITLVITFVTSSCTLGIMDYSSITSKGTTTKRQTTATTTIENTYYQFETSSQESDVTVDQTTKESTVQCIDNCYYPATVINVIDGDTLDVLLGSETCRVRLIGINTPESVDLDKPVEYYGIESAEFTRNLLNNQDIYLEFDEQLVDKYQRALAYVYFNDIFVNELLVKNGYATVATYPPNVRYEKLFTQAEQYARDNCLGMFKSTPTTQVQTEASQVVYYYISTSSKEIFHYLNCEWADRINKNYAYYYPSRQDAINSGCRPCKVCTP
ncbi:MAG TPA: thermonuclease family protein [Oscillospiraceae bacterium]|nr:thermonuclease family protein [Oscillospiraceae bacterium]